VNKLQTSCSDFRWLSTTYWWLIHLVPAQNKQMRVKLISSANVGSSGFPGAPTDGLDTNARLRRCTWDRSQRKVTKRSASNRRFRRAVLLRRTGWTSLCSLVLLPWAWLAAWRSSREGEHESYFCRAWLYFPKQAWHLFKVYSFVAL